MKKPPYSCPRCGYNTYMRTDMKRHFYGKTKTCPSLIDNMTLTEDVMNHIMNNRILHPQQETPSQQISVVNNLLSALDPSFSTTPLPFKKNQKEEVQTSTKASESFYQCILEAYLGGTHKQLLNVGITDVTTDTIHAEIKTWSLWKAAIGQLKAYNVADPKTEMQIYLFGDCRTDVKEEATNIITKNGIKCFEFLQVHKHKIQIMNCKTYEVVFECFAIIPSGKMNNAIDIYNYN